MPPPRAPQGFLLLIHQIPPRPNYLRVKIGRRLQRLGAVAIKNSVYALPAGEQAREDLDWVLREIVAAGGEGSLVQGQFVEGLSDEQVRELFRAARDADYQPLAADARALLRRFPRQQAAGRAPSRRAGGSGAAPRAALEGALAKLQERLSAIALLDFFHARGREPVEGLLRDLALRLAPPGPAPDPAALPRPDGALWITRAGIHVDRMASAWLIRRFIDPRARLRFVAARDTRARPGAYRFDMVDGEFTHEGDLCTFEVLLARFQLDDPALRPLAELVHDIDLKDDKHGRPEKAGVELLINAIATAHPGDEARLARASAVLDDLYELFKRKRKAFQ